MASNDILLKNILDDIESGDIQLPDFQRGWVWDDNRIRELLVSISRGFPIGAVMTLDATGEVRFANKPIEGVEITPSPPPQLYLLDGQQRFTSLYQALRHPKAVSTKGGAIKRWYYIDIQKALDPLIDPDETIFSIPEDRVIRRDFGRSVVLDLSQPEYEYANHMIPTEEAMNGMEWGFNYANYWQKQGGHPKGDPFEFFKQFNNAVLSNFSNYQVPVISLDKDTSKEAVCTVFEKVNTGGVTLSVFELVTASFAAGNFRLREDWDGRCKAMRSAFGILQGINGDHFLQAVTLLATQARRNRAQSSGKPTNQLPAIDCRRNSILDLTLDEYREWSDKVQAGFINAAKFLNRQFIFTNRNVPYNTQIVPLAALYASLGDELEPAIAQQKLARWYWCGVFGEVYGAAVETQFANDLVQVAEYIKGGAEPELLAQANFGPARLLTLRTRNSAAYKGVYALQLKNGAADWRTGQPLSLTHIFEQSVDIHHIFPRRWCEREAKPEIPRRLFDSIINKTPIDSHTNRIIGGRAPSRYLPRLREDIDSANLEDVLIAHWIHPSELENDGFGHCFVERGQALYELINDTMGKPISDVRQVFREELASANVVHDIFEDEDEDADPFGEMTLEAA